MTRADWYARHTGGGWRVARLAHRCGRVNQDGIRCVGRIAPGTQYFDTNQHDQRSTSQWATVRLCASCAHSKVGV